MNFTDSKMALAFANQISPRMKMNDATAEVWQATLHAHEPVKVRWAITQHYGTGNANGESTYAINMASIRRLIQSKTETFETQVRALEPPRNRVGSPESFRQRNPELWDKHFAAGQAAYHENQEKDEA